MTRRPEPVPGFDAFYSSARPPLARLAYALTGSTTEADDLAQETLSRAFARWSTVSTLESPLGWCRRVLLYLVFSRTRRLRNEAAAVLRLGAWAASRRRRCGVVLMGPPRSGRRFVRCHPGKPRSWRCATAPICRRSRLQRRSIATRPRAIPPPRRARTLAAQLDETIDESIEEEHD
ncbi:MAG: sigma factor [Microthrixaceae bacterium]